MSVIYCFLLVVKQQVQENDIHRLCQRQKQIEYGKNTSGYERYIELIPLYYTVFPVVDMNFAVMIA